MSPRWPLALFLVCHGAALAAPACTASSGPARTSLLELYTSEGCSSCPPADQWLSTLRELEMSGNRLAPLAFHVDYWNGLGWTDRFSNPAYSARQRWLAGVSRARTVYTPQFVLDGRDWRPGWGGGPPAPRPGEAPILRLALGKSTATSLDVAGSLEMRGAARDIQVFLALHENRLSSRIEAGENAGNLLRHDYVVRQLLGPLHVPAGDGRLDFRLALRLEQGWKREDLNVTVFAQSASTGEVFQALQMALCRGTAP